MTTWPTGRSHAANYESHGGPCDNAARACESREWSTMNSLKHALLMASDADHGRSRADPTLSSATRSGAAADAHAQNATDAGLFFDRLFAVSGSVVRCLGIDSHPGDREVVGRTRRRGGVGQLNSDYDIVTR
jgi:hypothetical protein